MHIVNWVLPGILIITFTIVGYGKLSGARAYHFAFIRWRLPQSFRIITGIIELLGAFLLIIGIWFYTFTFIGSFLLLMVCIGGLLVHLANKDRIEDMAPIMLLGLISIIYIAVLLL